MVNVNFVAPLLIINSLLPYMPQGSTVVNVVTSGIFVLMRQLPLYGATKIALHYASKALRNELRQKGIKLVQVYPGLINTNFHPRAGLPEATRGEPPENALIALRDPKRAVQACGGPEEHVQGLGQPLRA